MATRYEERYTILMTNLSFIKRDDVLGVSVIAYFKIDRLVNHCKIIKNLGF